MRPEKHPILLAFNIGEELLLKDKGIGEINAYQSIGNFLSAILPNVYVLASLIFFLLLIVGGFVYILNAGKGKSEEAVQGAKIATSAVIGFVIIFISYWLIKIIEVITGLKIFESGI